MKTLKELYLEAARVAELEEQYPTIFTIRYKNNYYNAASLMNAYINWNAYRGEIEFALAIVEGKPVFVGDVLYYKTNDESYGIRWYPTNVNHVFDSSSWNPPNPRTVMVELLVEDAEALARNSYSNSVVRSCAKALEELK